MRDIDLVAQKAGLVVARRAGEPENPHDMDKKLRELLKNDTYEFAELCDTFSLIKTFTFVSKTNPEDIIEVLRDERFKNHDFDKLKAFSAQDVELPRGGTGDIVFFAALNSPVDNVADLIKALKAKYENGGPKARAYFSQIMGVEE